MECCNFFLLWIEQIQWSNSETKIDSLGDHCIIDECKCWFWRMFIENKKHVIISLEHKYLRPECSLFWGYLGYLCLLLFLDNICNFSMHFHTENYCWKTVLLHQFSGYSLETLSYREWQNERVSKQTDVKLVRQWITDSICLYESLQLLINWMLPEQTIKRSRC